MYLSGKKISELSDIFGLQYRTIKKYIKMTEEECLKKISKLENLNNKISYRKKQELVKKTKELYSLGKTYTYIKEQLGLSYETAKKYINSTEPIIYRTSKREKSIDPYVREIIMLLNKNNSKKKIYNIIKEKGYTGAMRTFYNNLSKIISEQEYNTSAENENKDNQIMLKVETNTFLKLLYKPIESIKEINIDIYNQIIFQYKWLPEILDIIVEFKNIVKEKNLIKYIFWIEKLKKLNIPELNSFIKSLERDNDAIINAIYYRYTNGLAEGFVNKLKTLKRLMYGKASFHGLRRKLLWSERGE